MHTEEQEILEIQEREKEIQEEVMTDFEKALIEQVESIPQPSMEQILERENLHNEIHLKLLGVMATEQEINKFILEGLSKEEIENIVERYEFEQNQDHQSLLKLNEAYNKRFVELEDKKREAIFWNNRSIRFEEAAMKQQETLKAVREFLKTTKLDQEIREGLFKAMNITEVDEEYKDLLGPDC